MRRNEQAGKPNPHKACDEQILRLEAQVDTYDELIEKAMERHRPDITIGSVNQDLRPGNFGREIPFYCGECRRPWPCAEFHNLSAMYGKAHNWHAACEPYAPLVLKKMPTPDLAPSPRDPETEREVGA